MNKIIRRALLVAAIYFAGTYYFDRPEEVKKDAAALREMTAQLPEPERVIASVQASREKAGQSVFQAKQRLDYVRDKVQHSIALGTERFAGSD